MSQVNPPINNLYLASSENVVEKKILSFSMVKTKKFFKNVYKKPLAQKTKQSFVQAVEETVVLAEYSLVMVVILLG